MQAMSWHVALAAFCAAAAQLANKHAECDGWARAGECNGNPKFMNAECARSCAEVVVEPGAEMEQCPGWAAQGECTRNPKFMMTTCPKNCAEQRAKVVDGLLDTSPSCIDSADAAACVDPTMAKRCPGSCASFEFCAADADPAECRRALRCRELKDERSDCASRVVAGSCHDESSAAYLLKHCYLSCARKDLGGLLRRFRKIVSVRTRRHGLLDEDTAHSLSGRRAGARLLPLACWSDTVFDEPPAATCRSARAQLLQRWLRAAPRCAALRKTTPRAGGRRRLPPLPAAAAVSELTPGQAAPQPTVLPVLLSPKVRLVEDFVSAAEAEHVRRVGLPLMHRSLAGGRTESIRTSSTAMLPPRDPVVRAITERAAHISGYPYANIEPLQLVQYTAGQRYEPHFDYGEACDFEENLRNGHRHVTMLVYLNDVPEEDGGHTVFPKLELKLSPKARAAITFNDCLPNGQEDPRTLHGGSPPSNGTKVAINIWIRAQPFSRGLY